MYATTSIRDAYRKFRDRDNGFLYAFGHGDSLFFVLGDARKVNELLPDIPLETSLVGYVQIKVHSQDFFHLVSRLRLKGQKVAMVARRVNSEGKVSYWISEKFEGLGHEEAH